MTEIVVGFDGSAAARTAALWAAKEAASRHCELLLVHVIRGPVPELVYTPLSTPLPMAVTEESVRAHAENELTNLAAECVRLSPGLGTTTRVEYGHPADVLDDLARDAEMLVVGSSGRSGVNRALLGSTAADLAGHHKRPIVVVREAKASEGPVVVGVDGSDTSAAAIDFAFGFAERHDRDLIAVHAWSDMPVEALAPLEDWGYNWDQVRTESEAVIARCVAGHQETYPDVRVKHHVSFHGPAQALLEVADDAGLLVVGSHGRGVVRRALLGSVSHAVLYHAPCPVAVVRRKS
ncbi:Nucleotide-binding universal stress protein, UspA family [Lentzea albidocapillata subsp. violacea]|uniref:Nucleotide-binding universal stress protein, UspA family n=1 Tax=Lentzea albidocapillata subsp. violacea TaxID=128104 RepID=A0A1G8QBA1_9PSEU|nr:universal stress protein [Lentzea albidocapillata]SDJ02084.1 Nucleotide-binding universal stress protein, UspA family [Lentzea albidocapillata subsp. violacea]